ncbi:MAG: cytochrome c [Rhodobacteraceae bacterium]|nr:cytochrome c [Paracoccaceae bacterium]
MSKNLILLFGGVVVAGSAVLYMNFQKAPPSPVHTVEDTSGIAVGALLTEVALPAELSGNAQLGARIYEAKCAVCHGANAAGQNNVAPPLIDNIYRPGHHGEGAFISAALNGVTAHHWTFGNMPKIEGVTRADVKSIVVYIRELQRENGIN